MGPGAKKVLLEITRLLSERLFLTEILSGSMPGKV